MVMNQTENEEEFYNKLNEAIDKRFPDAKFSICCFDSIDEIQTKILNDTDEFILYEDDFCDFYFDEKTRKYTELNIIHDKVLIKRKAGKDCITYADVIDQLIEHDFERDCDHKFLESIDLILNENRNKKALKSYSSFFGS
jgi:arginyl-tRNA synthetase